MKTHDLIADPILRGFVVCKKCGYWTDSDSIDNIMCSDQIIINNTHDWEEFKWRDDEVVFCVDNVYYKCKVCGVRGDFKYCSLKCNEVIIKNIIE